MRGRIPKPTALKKLQGNPGHRKLNDASEPQPKIVLGEPPAHLDDEAKRYWFEQGALLVELGTLGDIDNGLFALLCQAQSRNVWLSAQVDRLKRLKRLSPRDEKRLEKFETQRLKNAAQIQKFGAEFGIGAASRTRIRVKIDDGQGELELGSTTDPLAQAMFLSRSTA